MLELGKEDQKVRSSSFEGLDEEQLNTIYRLASHRTLEKGETLFREGEADQTLYVVLEGEIRVVRNLQGQSETISVMHRGAWLGEFGFAAKMPRTETAFASKPSRVLAINKAVVDALDEKTQLPLFKRVCLLGSLRNRNHALRERELAAKNRQLIEALFSTRTKGKLDYTASQMVQSIVNRIPKLPAFASTLAYKLLLEGTPLKEVSETIKGDPALVGVLMKTINSAFYGFHKKISDVHRAVVLLGVNEIYQLVMGAGVRRTMPDTPYFRTLHYHSFAISYIGSILSQKAQQGNAPEIATIGLLHDLGNILAKLLIEKYPAVEMLIDAQHRAHMGALLLQRWNLPDVVSQSVAFQCYPEFTPPAKIPPEIRINVALLYLSHFCYDIFQGDSEYDLATPFLDDYLCLLNWGRVSMSDITRKFVLPDLFRKRQSFPVFFREMIEKNLQPKQHDT